jgi:2-iminobutanoate/2-iminopropanoate deaminase
MSPLTPVHSDRAPRAIGPYSQAIEVDGWLFCSGQIPVDPESGELSTGDIRQQTDLVLKNLTSVLEAAGSSLLQVVKTTVFLADIRDFTAMNEVYAGHFGDHRPARSTVQVGALPRGCSVEIECIAYTGARES